VDECKPLPPMPMTPNNSPAACARESRTRSAVLTSRTASARGRSGRSDAVRQGLTLVHFSAQPELFLTHNTP
jgi:hypothetical protein